MAGCVWCITNFYHGYPPNKASLLRSRSSPSPQPHGKEPAVNAKTGADVRYGLHVPPGHLIIVPGVSTTSPKKIKNFTENRRMFPSHTRSKISSRAGSQRRTCTKKPTETGGRLRLPDTMQLSVALRLMQRVKAKLPRFSSALMWFHALRSRNEHV